MLLLANRLRKVRDFNLILQYGRYAKNGDLTLRYVPLMELPVAAIPKRENSYEFRRQLKCGFSVGLKVSKKAVERNRLRRRLREIVRVLIAKKMLRSGNYLLFIGNKKLLTVRSDELLKSVCATLRQAGLLLTQNNP